MASSLADSGAQALIGAMGTDVWAATKSGFAYLLSAGSAEQAEQWEVRLEESAGLVAAGQSQAQAAEWAQALEQLLSTDPEVQARLTALVGEISGRLATGGGTL
jgi:hypothetical protein